MNDFLDLSLFLKIIVILACMELLYMLYLVITNIPKFLYKLWFVKGKKRQYKSK
jgi:hypothetical protein